MHHVRMLTAVGLFIVSASLLLTLLNKTPSLEDFMSRPVYAQQRMARWASRAAFNQAVTLVGFAVMAIGGDWLSWIILAIGAGTSVVLMRRMVDNRRQHLERARQWEDAEIARTPVPDSPPDLL